MLNLIKYELRNTKTAIKKILIVLAITSLLLQVIFWGNLMHIISASSEYGTTAFAASGILWVLLFFGIVAVSIVSLVWFYSMLAGMLKSDIYQNEGYTTLSLPVSGYKIIGAKTIVGIFWSIILPILLVSFNILIFFIAQSLMDPVNMKEYVGWIYSRINFDITLESIGFILVYIAEQLVGSIFLMMVIFGAITLDYLLSKKKENSAMWIIYVVIFLVLNSFVFGILFPASGVSINFEDTFNYYTTSNNYYTLAVFRMLYSVGISMLLYYFVSHNYENKLEKF